MSLLYILPIKRSSREDNIAKFYGEPPTESVDFGIVSNSKVNCSFEVISLLFG